jgi:signal transduction histidine kinase
MKLQTFSQRVLNVDDTNAARYAKSRILTRAGFDVIEASSGVETLRRVREDQPVLVLLDTRLPDISGFDVCRQIKEDPDTRHVLVLQTSASHIGMADKVKALDLGADSYLYEPIEPEELVANVKALMRLARVEHELREVDRRKDEFLAILAHELRNPLGPIRNAVELLRQLDPYAPAAQENARKTIIRQTDHLVRLVDDLLDVSRISQGKITLRSQRVQLQPLVLAAVETAHPALDRMGHTLTLDLPEPPIWVNADSVRVTQAVGNLLNNAAKFTPARGKISLSLAREDGMAVIRVGDNGIGISADQIETIFDLFAQGRHTTERVQEGLGIGLSLVRTLVEMHGGQVAVSSAGVGQGSEFLIRLPLLADNMDVADHGAAPASSAPVTARRILVVDDNGDSAEMLSTLLGLAGHTVGMAHDGASALAAAQRYTPELAVLDIGLPDMSGYELAQALRALPGFTHIRLVALTGYGQEQDRNTALAQGFNAHLTKPVAYEVLTATIDKLFPG